MSGQRGYEGGVIKKSGVVAVPRGSKPHPKLDRDGDAVAKLVGKASVVGGVGAPLVEDVACGAAVSVLAGPDVVGGEVEEASGSGAF